MKKMILATAATLVFLLVCTVVSYKNYVNGLNRVAVTDSVPGRIRIQTEADGFLRFAETGEILAQEGVKVQNIVVEPGQNFKEGDLLAMLDDHTAIKAPCSGQLISMDFEAGDVLTAENNRVVYGVVESGVVIEWSLAPEQYKRYHNLRLDAPSLGMTVKCEGLEGIYDMATKRYYFEQVIAQPEEFSGLCNGQPAALTLFYESEEYDAVIPKSSVVTIDDATFIYLVRERSTLHGVERYLHMIGVTVEESDDINAAIGVKAKDVVTGSARRCQDLEAVLVIE